MGVLFWLIVFAVSLTVLLKASDWFVDSAEKIGLAFGIPPFIIGVTIVAAGTSLPELAASIAAVIGGQSEIVVGNVVGSNITNIFLVMGISMLVGKGVQLKHDISNIDIPMLFGSSFLLWFVLSDGQLDPFEVVLLLMGMVCFLGSTFSSGGDNVDSGLEKPNWKTYAVLAASCVLVFIGAKYTVDSISKLAEASGIGTGIISQTLVALGTSIPEVIVSIAAVRKGQADMAVGNVLGSNIFNTFAVMGIPALFGALTIPSDILVFSMPLMIVATLLFWITTASKKFEFWKGALLLLFYVFFIGKFVQNLL